MAVTIDIKGTSYPIKFGMGAFKILGTLWGFKGRQGVFKKISESFTEEEAEEVSFAQLEVLAAMTYAGITNAKAESPEVSELEDFFFLGGGSDQIAVVMDAFSAEIPQAKGNPQPLKGQGKGKPKVKK